MRQRSIRSGLRGSPGRTGGKSRCRCNGAGQQGGSQSGGNTFHRTHGADRRNLRNGRFRHDAVRRKPARCVCHDSYRAERRSEVRHTGTNHQNDAPSGKRNPCRRNHRTENRDRRDQSACRREWKHGNGRRAGDKTGCNAHAGNGYEGGRPVPP